MFKYKVPAIICAVLILGAGSGLFMGAILENKTPVKKLEHKTAPTSNISESPPIEVTVDVEVAKLEPSDEHLDEGVFNPDVDIFSLQPDPVPESFPKEQPLLPKQWEKASLPFDLATLEDGRPLISIIIDDVGVAQHWSKKVIALSGPMTMSFIPYGRNLVDHVSQAQKNGHEIMLHIPMEPGNPDIDPGENALKTTMDTVTLVDNLLWNLEQFDGYMGINNHMGSKFTAWEEGMQLVLSEIKLRELVFIDSVTSAKTVGYTMAKKMEIPTAVRDIFLDHDMSEEAVKIQLQKTEAIALKKGYVIAIGHPHENTINALTEWLKDIESRGFHLVPASVIVKRLNTIQKSAVISAND